MKKLTKEILAMSTAFLTVTSCVDKNYDLSKPIDSTMNLIPGLTVPLGKMEMTLDYLMNLNEEGGNDVIKTDADGNYFLSMTDKASENKIEVSIPGFSFKTADFKSIPIESPMPIPYVPGNADIPYIELTEAINFDFHVNQTSGIPGSVKSIASANIDGTTEISIRYNKNEFPFANIYIKEGSKITFPEWALITNLPAGFAYGANKHEIISQNVITVPADGGRTLTFELDKIDFTKFAANQGFINGSFIVDGEVTIENVSFNFKSSEVIGSPASGTVYKPEITFAYQLSELEVNEISGVFNPEININDFEYSMGELPEQLQGANAVLDMAALQIDFDIYNSSPAKSFFGFNLRTYKEDYQLKELKFSGLTIEANGNTKYSISEDGTKVTEGYTPYAKEGLNSILIPMPDKFVIADMDCRLAEENITFPLPSTYQFDFSYNVTAPLSFGEKAALSLPFVIPINASKKEDGSNESESGDGTSSVEVSAPSAILKAKIQNTIPLNFTLACTVCDADGNELPSGSDNIRIEVILKDEMIKGGTVEKPGESEVEIQLTGIDMDFNIPAIKLDFSASGSSELKGICLNEKQAIVLSGISLSVPEGITISNLF
ncbi:MAG: hypothetical protein ACI3ZQ_02845 [Candidatus Cryptobacteroides sp.]